MPYYNVSLSITHKVLIHVKAADEAQARRFAEHEFDEELMIGASNFHDRAIETTDIERLSEQPVGEILDILDTTLPEDEL